MNSVDLLFYGFTYTPEVRGRHSLIVKVNSTQIVGSPFQVYHAMFIHLRALKSSSPHTWHSVIHAIVIHYIHVHTPNSPQQLIPLTYSVVTNRLGGCAILTCTCSRVLNSLFSSHSVLHHHVSYSPIQETLHITHTAIIHKYHVILIHSRALDSLFSLCTVLYLIV